MGEIKIQFCCGGNKPDGWLNHDMDMPIHKPIPYPDNYADRIFCEHGVEHTDSVGLIAFLESCYRILKPGGTLRICVPVIDRRMTRTQARDLAINHTHQHIHTRATIGLALWIAGFDPNNLTETERDPLDHHWTVIGKQQDDFETYRCEVTK